MHMIVFLSLKIFIISANTADHDQMLYFNLQHLISNYTVKVVSDIFPDKQELNSLHCGMVTCLKSAFESCRQTVLSLIRLLISVHAFYNLIFQSITAEDTADDLTRLL